MIYPQASRFVYNFLLLDEYNRSCKKKCPGSLKIYYGIEWLLIFNNPIEEQ